MKLIRPSYEILTPLDGAGILKNIEAIGRVCYKSEALIKKGSAEKLVQKLIDSKHESVLEHAYMTVKFICDRGVSHELVRHRIASFTQESTRYCNYSKGGFGNELTFIIPPWVSDADISRMSIDPARGAEIWYEAMLDAEGAYLGLLRLGWKPEQARDVLPVSVKTEIAVTANLREWRFIFSKRAAKDAHPQMRELMVPLLAELKTAVPIMFDDIEGWES